LRRMEKGDWKSLIWGANLQRERVSPD
jgi:hypothetical protein